MYTTKDLDRRMAQDAFEKEVLRMLKENIKGVADDLSPAEIDESGSEEQYVAAISQAIGSVMIHRVPPDTDRGETMRACFRIVQAEMGRAGRALDQLKKDLAEGRRCAECGATMKLDRHHTRLWDFWTCPKCGYWDCTKHIVRNWPPKGKGK